MSICGEAESILTRVCFHCCLRRLRYSLCPLAITLLQVTVLPPHTGVGGVAPWTAVGIWVSAVILAQAPTNVNMLYYITLLYATAQGRAQKNILESRSAMQLANMIYHVHSVMAN